MRPELDVPNLNDLLTRIRSHEGAVTNFALTVDDDLLDRALRRVLWQRLVNDAERWDALGSSSQAADARRLADEVGVGLPFGCQI